MSQSSRSAQASAWRLKVTSLHFTSEKWEVGVTQGPEPSSLAQLKWHLLQRPSSPDTKLPTGPGARRIRQHWPHTQQPGAWRLWAPPCHLAHTTDLSDPIPSSLKRRATKRPLPSFWGPSNLCSFSQ